MGLGTRRVTIVTRTEANAEALAAHARKLGLEATAVARAMQRAWPRRRASCCLTRRW